MEELYKVRKISISIIDSDIQDVVEEYACDYGTIIEKEGILFLEVHIFDAEGFNKFLYGNLLGSSAKGKMLSFENIDIEAPNMVLTSITTKENKVTFRCFGYILVNQTDPGISIKDVVPSQLSSIEFWGLDLLISPQHDTFNLMVSNVPFEIKFIKDKKSGNLCAYFPGKKYNTHNTLTDELFVLFRESLIGYLSFVNGASVQIIREDFFGYCKIYSYNRIENISRSYYLCGNAKRFAPSSILYEFDNYVRWNEYLNLNKFVHHLCAAQQLQYVEDRSFILIVAFEGLCGNYEKMFCIENKDNSIVSKETFKSIKKEFFNILKRHEISSDECTKLKSKIGQLNVSNSASHKFGLILDNLNIQRTSEIKDLIKEVRNTIVHEATLSGFEEYQLLSELLREILARLINSKVKRYSEFNESVFLGEEPKLSFNEHIQKHTLNADKADIIKDDDKRIKLWLYPPQRTNESTLS